MRAAVAIALVGVNLGWHARGTAHAPAVPAGNAAHRDAPVGTSPAAHWRTPHRPPSAGCAPASAGSPAPVCARP
ncbi:hypothetical protein G6F57_021789 [Rhizopus arrhizus]|nr:hypothetical protein G6F31_021813 [Rhizopus arrhizus]KAG1434027.1 hypothetical protein G6F57_021789 [Rhizopus arrhizus]